MNSLALEMLVKPREVDLGPIYINLRAERQHTRQDKSKNSEWTLLPCTFLLLRGTRVASVF